MGKSSFYKNLSQQFDQYQKKDKYKNHRHKGLGREEIERAIESFILKDIVIMQELRKRVRKRKMVISPNRNKKPVSFPLSPLFLYSVFIIYPFYRLYTVNVIFVKRNS